MEKILEYYRVQSPLTNPGSYAYLYDPLPDSIPELVEIIQSLLVHRLAAEQIGARLTKESRREQSKIHPGIYR